MAASSGSTVGNRRALTKLETLVAGLLVERIFEVEAEVTWAMMPSTSQERSSVRREKDHWGSSVMIQWGWVLQKGHDPADDSAAVADGVDGETDAFRLHSWVPGVTPQEGERRSG